jgi:hypothetical protein
MKNAPTPGPSPKNRGGGTGQRPVRYLDGVFEADLSPAIVGPPPIFITLLELD